ncbi:MAG: transposase [Candidatus Azotimanducaceae bacterium]
MIVHGYPVLEVSKRLGIANKSLYDWIKVLSKPTKQRAEESDLRVAWLLV